jgi:hypothetical protein
MRTLKTLTIACVVLSVATPSVQAQLITFDDLPVNGACGAAFITNGYQGLDWSNFSWLAGTDCSANNGYINGTVSRPHVAFNAFGNPASFSRATTFAWSGYLTAAWRNAVDVTITGMLGTTTVYTDAFQLGIAGPTLKTYGLAVDQVIISASGGINPGGLGGDGTQIAFDDVNVVTAGVVPEPGTVVLFATGLVVIAGAARRRRQA